MSGVFTGSWPDFLQRSQDICSTLADLKNVDDTQANISSAIFAAVLARSISGPKNAASHLIGHTRHLGHLVFNVEFQHLKQDINSTL